VAYRADIEIAVRGAQELQRLQNQIRVTGDAVDSLNSSFSAVANLLPRSINNLNSVAAQAAENFNKVALGTKEAEQAARDYIDATNQLNNGLRERLRLIRSIEAADLAASRTIRPGDAGYGQQTPALPPAFIRAAEIQQNWAAFFRDAAELATDLLSIKSAKSLELRQAWNTFFTDAAELGNELKNRAASKSLELKQVWNTFFTDAAELAADLSAAIRQQEGAASARARRRLAEDAARRDERAAFLAGSPAAAFPFGPNPSTKRFRFENDVSVEEAETALLKKERQKQTQINKDCFAYEKQQLTELDRARATAAKKETARRQALVKTIKGSLSSAAIGGAFPLLFGQSAEAAVGGAVGGLLGGPQGGFAGSLIGTALGEIAAKQNVIKELSAELGLAANQTTILATAFEQAGKNSEQFQAAVLQVQGLSLAVEDQVSILQLASRLTGEYGGSVDKVTKIYADFVSRGKVGIADLTKLTAQGIPIQQALADKYGISRTQVLQYAKDGKISVQDLSDTLFALGNTVDGTTGRAKTGFDRFKDAVNDVATAVVSLARTLAEVLGPVLDVILSKIARGLRGLNQLLTNQVSSNLGKAGLAFTFGFESQGIDNLRTALEQLSTVTPQSQEDLNQLNNQLVDISNNLRRVGPESTKTNRDLATSLQGQVLRLQQKFGTFAFGQEDGPIAPVTVPSNLPPGGRSSRARKDRAAEEAARLQATLDQLTEQLRIENKLYDLEVSAAAARADGNLELLASIESDKRLLDIQEKRSKVQKDFDSGKIGVAEKTLRLQLLTIEIQKDQLLYEQGLNDLFRERYGITEAIIRESRKFRELAFGTEAATGTFRTDLNLMPGLTDGLIGEEIQKLTDDLKELTSAATLAIGISNAVGESFATSFKGIISGSMTAKEALANFFQSVADYFLDMAAQIIQKWIQMTILNSILGLFPGGSSVFGPSGAPNYSNTFGGPRFRPDLAFGGARAMGGPTRSNTAYMVGEQGPELFIPNRTGTVVPNNALGGATNVIVNVDAKGTSVQGNDQSGNQLGRAIAAAVQAELVKQKRPGGLLTT